MEKPTIFAGRVVHKYGKTSTNDYPQPNKFFADMEHSLRLLDEIPFSAIEEIEKYESNREIIVNVVRRCFKILDAAKVDVVKEIERMEADPFAGLEEDIAQQKEHLIKITGE